MLTRSIVPHLASCVSQWIVMANTVWFSLDYLFQLAVEMKQLGVPWLSDIPVTVPTRK